MHAACTARRALACARRQSCGTHRTAALKLYVYSVRRTLVRGALFKAARKALRAVFSSSSASRLRFAMTGGIGRRRRRRVAIRLMQRRLSSSAARNRRRSGSRTTSWSAAMTFCLPWQRGVRCKQSAKMRPATVLHGRPQRPVRSRGCGG